MMAGVDEQVGDSGSGHLDVAPSLVDSPRTRECSNSGRHNDLKAIADRVAGYDGFTVWGNMIELRIMSSISQILVSAGSGSKRGTEVAGIVCSRCTPVDVHRLRLPSPNEMGGSRVAEGRGLLSPTLPKRRLVDRSIVLSRTRTQGLSYLGSIVTCRGLDSRSRREDDITRPRAHNRNSSGSRSADVCLDPGRGPSGDLT